MIHRIFRRRYRFGVIAVIAAGLILAAMFAVHRGVDSGTAPYLNGTKVDYAKATTYWEQKIQRIGGPSAYALLTRQASALTLAEAHADAHAFGGALYRVLGIDGLSVCDINFDYGCYHEFVGSAIIDKGLNSLSSMYGACLGSDLNDVQAGGCLHGIGHGIVGYLGYSLSDLNQALKICGSLDGGNKTSLCTDGAYMEYNLRILASVGSSATSSDVYDPRPLTETDRYEPCASLDAEYQPGCIFELPIWWFKTPGSPSARDRAVLYGTYCSVYNEKNERFACFRGMGYILAGTAGLNRDTAQSYCDASSAEQTDRLYCYIGIIVQLKAIRGPSADVGALCQSFPLASADIAFCRAFIGIDKRSSF